MLLSGDEHCEPLCHPGREDAREPVDRWLTKAEEFAKSKSFDVNVLLGARLAPDQYALSRQVQAACDAAKFMAARLGGQPSPAHPSTETTMAELHARASAR